MVFKMSRGIAAHLLGYDMLLPLLILFVCLFPTPVSTLAWTVSKMKATVRHQTFQCQRPSCLCHGKSVIQACLYSFLLSLNTIAGSLMVFSAISRCFFQLKQTMIQTIWWELGEEKQTKNMTVAMLHSAILVQLQLEWNQSRENCTAHSCFIQIELELSGILQSALML